MDVTENKKATSFNMMRALGLNEICEKMHGGTASEFLDRAARSCCSTHFLTRSLVAQIIAALCCKKACGKQR